MNETKSGDTGEEVITVCKLKQAKILNKIVKTT